MINQQTRIKFDQLRGKLLGTRGKEREHRGGFRQTETPDRTAPAAD